MILLKVEVQDRQVLMTAYASFLQNYFLEGIISSILFYLKNKMLYFFYLILSFVWVDLDHGLVVVEYGWNCQERCMS